MKKIFGKVNLTWPIIIIEAILIGAIVGLLNCVPALLDTSFRDPAIYFTFWIFMGIFIIMNSKSNKDSALKCFVFFLISQPLIYLVEVPFVRMGWGIFTYYKYWIMWTILCLPMGYIGYYMKKNKWWGLLILLPMMVIVANELSGYVGGVIYYFPHHLLSSIFAISSLIIYPLFIFEDRKIKRIGLIIGIACILIAVSLGIFAQSRVYETQPLCDTEEHPFDDTYKVSLKDKEYGSVDIQKMTSSGEDPEVFYCVHAKFVKAGKTEIILESPEGEKKVFEIEIKKNTYNIEEKTTK